MACPRVAQARLRRSAALRRAWPILTALDPPRAPAWSDALVGYGAVILSFVGALHWGVRDEPAPRLDAAAAPARLRLERRARLAGLAGHRARRQRGLVGPGTAGFAFRLVQDRRAGEARAEACRRGTCRCASALNRWSPASACWPMPGSGVSRV
ncbi:MAG: DUF3429 domain-containing protein [Chromatiales bacterium]|nr:DUF3429 domain-containing protein [Chromatiales bacterium]